MASTSGLYDDSDSESLSNALSPTDGYFNERHSQPQDVHIPNPSQSTQADKEREAREESEASRSQGPSSDSWAVSRPTSNHSTFSPPPTPARRRVDPVFEDNIQSERTPLLPAAPPAYSPPTPSSPYQHTRSASQGSAGGYSTMGRHELFMPYGEPEDLGGETLLGGPPRRDGWRQRSGDWLKENTNKIAKYVLILLALSIGIGFIVNIVTNIKGLTRKVCYLRQHPYKYANPSI